MRSTKNWLRPLLWAVPILFSSMAMVMADGVGPLLARITLRHDFFGDATPPIRLMPLPAAGQRPVRLHRFQDGVYAVFQPAGMHRSGQLAFLLLADDPVLLQLQDLPVATDLWRFDVPQDETAVDVRDAHPEPRDPTARSNAVARLVLTPAKDGVRDLTVTLPTRAVDWVYVVIGAPDDASIASSDGTVLFQREADRVLPSGATAAVYRSGVPVPLTRNASDSYVLTGTGTDGRAISLNLPSSSPDSLKPGDVGQQGAVQAEMVVTLR